MTQSRRDELRQQRARDMLAVIEHRPPPAPSGVQGVPTGRGDPGIQAATTPAGPQIGEPVESAGKAPGASTPLVGSPTGSGLMPCSARELEWLPAELTLLAKILLRTGTVGHVQVGVVSPYLPSMLFVIYQARYSLSVGSPPPATRDVYTGYSAAAAFLPTTRPVEL